MFRANPNSKLDYARIAELLGGEIVGTVVAGPLAVPVACPNCGKPTRIVLDAGGRCCPACRPRSPVAPEEHPCRKQN